jgi:outer membrane protein OmpA-like peptidoglycan-associated protein
MNYFASPAALDGARRSALRRLLGSWFLVLLFLAVLVLGCKKSTPANGDTAPTPEGTPTPNSDTGSATPGGGGVSPNAADQPGSLADRLKAVQAGPPPDPSKQIHLPSWKPVSSSTSNIQIPLVVGLVDDAVITCKYGDLESIRTISGVNSKTVTMDLAGDLIVKTPPPPATSPITTKHVSGTRVIDVTDLASAHHLTPMFQIGKTQHEPGSTPLTVSTEVLNQLRAGQSAVFDYQIDPTSMVSDALSGHATVAEALVPWGTFQMLKCPLQRVEPTDLSIPVLVNDVPIELPAIHAKCDLSSEEQANFYILDQPSNPILLATQVAPSQDRSQVIKLSWPQTPPGGLKGPASSMESALAAKKPVQIYGIYFDFNSDKLKPESDAVLQQISDILHKNPDWKLNVSGHTDNIGDDAFNLNLSQRRAAAVKNALVTRYKIAPDRLTPSGYGSSRPVAPNTTFEGRALNRRVELQRQ